MYNFIDNICMLMFEDYKCRVVHFYNFVVDVWELGKYRLVPEVVKLVGDWDEFGRIR